jgi:hypothetical protein
MYLIGLYTRAAPTFYWIIPALEPGNHAEIRYNY